MFSCLCCAFAVLLSLSLCPVMPLKRSIFDFAVFGGVFIGVKSLNAIVRRFRAFDACACFPLAVIPCASALGDPFRRCARAVRDR